MNLINAGQLQHIKEDIFIHPSEYCFAVPDYLPLQTVSASEIVITQQLFINNF